RASSAGRPTHALTRNIRQLDVSAIATSQSGPLRLQPPDSRLQSPGTEEQSRGDSADAWHHEEHPELSHSLAADEQRGTEAACRVDTDARDTDAEHVNHHEGDADGQAGKCRRSALLGAAENHDHKDQGSHKFEDDRRGQVIAALVANAPSILTQAACSYLVTAGHA